MGSVTVEFPNVKPEDSFALPEGFSIDLPGPTGNEAPVQKLVPNRSGDMQHAADLARGFDYTPGDRESTYFEKRKLPGWRSIFTDDDQYDTSGFTVPKGFEIDPPEDWADEVIEPMVREPGKYPFAIHPAEIMGESSARTPVYEPDQPAWEGSNPTARPTNIGFQLPEGFTIDTPISSQGINDMGVQQESRLGETVGVVGGEGKEGAIFKKNPDGTITFKPWDSLQRFVTSGNPRDVERAAWEIATTMAAGGFSRGALSAKGTNELGIFGGKLGAEKAGKELTSVGKDELPRFEIDDTGFKWRNDFWGQFAARGLSKYIDHPELFKAYPELNKIRLTVADSLRPGNAVFDEARGVIYMSGPDIGTEQGRSILVHELQHAVQAIEGHARGGAAKVVEKQLDGFIQELVKGNYTPDMIKKIPPDLYPLETLYAISKGIQKYDSTSDYGSIEGILNTLKILAPIEQFNIARLSAHEYYLQLAGEAEARNAQGRMKMTKEERAATPPEKTEDIIRGAQIPLYKDADNNISMMDKGPPKVVKGGTEVVKENVDQLHDNLVKALKTKSPVDVKAAKQNIEALRTTAQGIMKESEDLLPPLRKEDADAMNMTMEQYKWYMLDDLMTEIDQGVRGLFETVVGGKDPKKEVTVDNVVQWLKDAGANVLSVAEKGKSKTTYIKFEDPLNPYVRGRMQAMPTVRIPKDEHIGKVGRYEEGGLVIDTGTRMPDMRDVDPSVLAKNVSGESYSDWTALVDAMKWRLSRSPDGNFLISPGREPKPRPSRELEARQEGTGSTISRDPNQLEFDFQGLQRPLYGPANHEFWHLKGDEFRRALHEYRMNKTSMPSRVLTPEEARRILDIKDD